MRTFFFLLLLLTGPLVAQRPTVSLVQLLANPEKFDGQVVRFHGVTNIEFEGEAVYLSKEHWKHTVTSCALWLDISEELRESRKWTNGRYMVLEGTFDKGNRGHMGLFMGTLKDIKLFVLHEIMSPAEIEKAQGKSDVGDER